MVELRTPIANARTEMTPYRLDPDETTPECMAENPAAAAKRPSIAIAIRSHCRRDTTCNATRPMRASCLPLRLRKPHVVGQASCSFPCQSVRSKPWVVRAAKADPTVGRACSEPDAKMVRLPCSAHSPVVGLVAPSVDSSAGVVSTMITNSRKPTRCTTEHQKQRALMMKSSSMKR